MKPATTQGTKPAIIKHGRSGLVILGLFFILSRIPLLNLGFGLDADAWRIANTAFDLRYHLQYHASRFPGYPVPEFFNALVIEYGWLATNSLTMILSLLSLFAYVRILKRIDHPSQGLLVITYSFLPMLWINSTNTMDYMWTLCFILLTWLLVLRKNWIVAGLLMGLAIGSRLPSSILALPFFYLCHSEDRKLKNGIIFLLTTTLATILCYVPLLLTYGWGFFHRYPSDTSLQQIGYMALKHFGLLPITALIVLLTVSFRKLHHAFIQHDRHVVFSLFVIIAGLLMFAFMPYHTEYLIPFIPFLLLLIYRVNKKPLLVLFSILIISHALITVIDLQHTGRGRIRTSIIERGTIIRNIEARQQQLEFAHQLIESPVQERSTVIIGPWLPIVAYLDENLSSVRETRKMYDPNRANEGVRNFQRDIHYRYLLTLNELLELRKNNYTIYYIEGIREFTMDVYAYDLADHQSVYLNLGHHAP